MIGLELDQKESCSVRKNAQISFGGAILLNSTCAVAFCNGPRGKMF